MKRFYNYTICLLVGVLSYAQSITGNTASCINDTEVYGVSGVPQVGTTFSWSAVGGTVQGSSTSSTASIKWTSSGTRRVDVTAVTPGSGGGGLEGGNTGGGFGGPGGGSGGQTHNLSRTVSVAAASEAGSLSTSFSVGCANTNVTITNSGKTGTIKTWEVRSKYGSGNWGFWSTFSTSSATSITHYLQTNSSARTYQFRVKVQNNNCSVAYAYSGNVTVDHITVAGSVSGASNRCSSGSTTYSLSGHTGTIHRWQLRYKNGSGGWTSWSTITETNNVTSVSPTLSQWSGGQRTYEIQAVVKSGNYCSTLYAKKTTSVDPSTIAGTISGASNRCGSGSTSFSISGQLGTIQRWQSRYKNGSGSWTGWSTITETDNVTSVSPSLSQWSGGQRTYEIQAVVKSGSCSTLYPKKSITVDPATVSGNVSGSLSRCGSGSETYSLSSHIGTIERWQQRSKDGTGSWSSWSTITETDNVTSVSPTLSQWSGGRRTYEIRATVKSGSCQTLYPAIVTVVDFEPTVFTVSGSGTFCSNTGGTITLSGSQTGVEYQLIISGTEFNVGLPLSGTGGSLNFGSLTAEGTYNVKATNTSGGCEQPMSGDATIVLYNQLQSGTITYTGGNVHFGDTPTTLDASPATEGNGSYDYQWEAKVGNASLFTSIVGEVNEDLSPGVHTQNVVYQRNANSCGESAYTPQVNIDVILPAILSSNGTNLLLGQSTTLSVPFVSANSYQWSKNGNEIVGATTPSIDVYYGGNYHVEVTASNNENYITPSITISDETVNQNSNFIKIRSFRVPVSDANELVDVGDVSDQFTYFDGIGRSVQSIQVSQSPDLQDVIVPMEYDQYGRATKDYRPYVEGQGGMERANALNALYADSDHSNYYEGSSHSTEGDAIAEVVYEASPLNRVLKQGSYGSNWQVNGGHAITFDYETNDTSEVRYFKMTTLLTTTTGDYYNAGELYKNTTTDEDGNQTIEYTKRGQTILKKSQVDGSMWAETYYIYDIYGQLAVVLPPEATDRLASEFFGKTEQEQRDFLNTWAFLYDFDERNRMTTKKVPGADSIFMVYDRWDRLVLTQDGNQRINNQWLFTKYDQLNRPIMTGIMNGGSEATERDSVASETNRFETSADPGINEYTDVTYPSDNLVDNYLTVTYYDNYFWDVTGLAFTNPAGLAKNDDVKGQVTGTLTKTGAGIGALPEGWIKSVSYYDDKYRPIQTQNTNHLGGTDIVTNYYDFIGQVNRSISLHDNVDTTFTTTRSFVYDHAGRLLETWHKMESATDSVLVAQNSYNEMGELVEKDLHGGTGGAFAQSLDYTYNIRGWLTSVNGSDLSTSNDGDLFGMELYYDTADVSGDIANPTYYNGNIGAMKWSTHIDEEWVDTKERAYRFYYDGLNRLEDAYGDINKGGSWNATEDYRGEYSYDKNGNIKTLKRQDMKHNHIDDLNYTYANGNQLQKVSDASSDSLGFHDGNTVGDDYEYDANGNMVRDRNKKIDSIYYNHLNLPIIVDFETAGDSIRYLYDAAGIKLQQRVYRDDTLRKATDYVGEFIYETDTSGVRELQLVQHEEGRLSPLDDGGFDYQYHLKDHLGNVRMTFSTTPENYTMVETFETGEENGWEDLHRHTSTSANTTVGGNEVERLQSGQTGAMVFLGVNKGDTVDLSINANYETAPSNNNFTGTVYGTLFNSFDNIYGSGVENGVISTSTVFNDALSGTDMSGKSNTSTAPRAFLNYIIFDKDMSYVRAGFQQISTSALGVSVHETISINDIIAEQEGYVLAYLSNENQEAVNVHFDDFTVYHGKTNVVSTQDYYPFGLTFNESSRTASEPQDFKFNGIERIDDFGLNWDMAEYRSYDPAIARWHQIDPKASERESPYVGFGNNPIFYADPLGDTVNLANIIINDRANGTNLAGKIVDGLSKVTGLTLSIGDNGLLSYAKDEDGNPIKVGNGGESADESPVGSESAANDLISLINGGKIDVRKGNDRTVAKGDEIFVSESQIDGFINQTPDALNSETMGYGMTMMHEFSHTNVGGALSDPKNKSDVTSTGATVDKVNQYRSELDSNGTVGKRYGTRRHYNAVPVGNGGYVTFQYRNLQRRVRSTRIKVK